MDARPRVAIITKTSRCQSEFDSLLDQLDELHDLLQWLERNKTDFLAWREARRDVKSQ